MVVFCVQNRLAAKKKPRGLGKGWRGGVDAAALGARKPERAWYRVVGRKETHERTRFQRDLSDRKQTTLKVMAIRPVGGVTRAPSEHSLSCSLPTECLEKGSKMLMILPKVHLRKPCYDFYSL